MKVVFRTDASLDIGIGHVMRCLTLADALRERGASASFICREHPGNRLEFIRQRGYEAHALPMGGRIDAGVPIHTAWLGADYRADACQTQAILAGSNADWLVVDHYALGAEWEQAVGSGRRLMAIDDLADRAHRCDLLLDQNLGHTTADYAGLVPTKATVLAGPKYALLRPEFIALREYSLQRRVVPELNQIMITMGGVDQPNATGKVLEALSANQLPKNCRIIVVMGAQAPSLEQVCAIAAALPWATEVRVDIGDMAQLMADSDLAIGAAGSTSWERCCLGLPSLLVALADNQLAVARALQTQGAVVLLGEPALIQSQLGNILPSLLSGKRLAEMSLAASAVTDGQGTRRVVQIMERQL